MSKAARQRDYAMIRAAGGILHFAEAGDEGCTPGRHLVAIGDVLDAPNGRGQPKIVCLEFLRPAGVERERVDRKSRDAALLGVQ